MKIFFCGLVAAAAAGLYARAASGWVGERLVNAMHLFYGYESSSFHPSLPLSSSFFCSRKMIISNKVGPVKKLYNLNKW